MKYWLAVFLFLSCNRFHNPAPNRAIDNNSDIQVKIFRNDTISPVKTSGFGYNIYRNNSLYIHQPHIPSIPGNMGFTSYEKANKAAMLVVFKIKNNIIPPSVSERELDSLGVK